MECNREIACGADFHKEFLVATILSNDGMKLQARFDMRLDGLLSFRNWIKENGCQKVAVESTANFWYPIYNILEDEVDIILANAYQIKHIPGRKTDTLDSEWIAELCLKNLIAPSRILPKNDRDLRALTRARENLVKMRSQIKNQVHQELESAHIKLSTILSDIFGKSGRHILDGLLSGTDMEEIVKCIPSNRVKKRKDEIFEAIKANLSQTQIFLLRTLLNSIDAITMQIEQVDQKISELISERDEDFKIALSIPGMGNLSAATVLAEIGDVRDFSTPEKLAAYCGLVPSVYQSAGKLLTGHITKHGSPHIRRMLVEVAHAISRTHGNSKLKRIYLRVKARKGAKVAILALARKVLCILHHLLINKELYQYEDLKKHKRIKVDDSHSLKEMSIDEIIYTLSRAGYEVRKRSTSEGR